MNRIDSIFKERKGKVLSIYFTAGYPHLDSTERIIQDLETAGADMIEIGMPFSDPLADGPVIQKSSEAALKNGMNIQLLFKQLENIRDSVRIPLILMGYLNPVQKYGVEEFCGKCSDIGIDGLILPDLPPEIYSDQYLQLFEKHNLYNILLISPQTDDERIRMIDNLSRGFVYLVSSYSTTGIRESFTDDQIAYFNRIKNMKLSNPGLIGFGISDRNSFMTACEVADGAIIGSAFVKMLGEKGEGTRNIEQFIRTIKH